MQADARAGGHVEGLKAGRLDPGHLNLQLVGQPDNLAAVVIGDLAGGIQLNAVDTGQGQRLAERLFHGMELMAGIGEGAAVEAGGIGEAASVRHVAEEPQRIHLHGIVV